MQYLLLIYDAEKTILELPEAERNQLYADYVTFTKEVRASGHFKAGDPLQPVHTATTVRVRDGKTVTTDGPFAETREQLGGYYLVDAKDLDEATALAARIPSAKYGSIEVRPVVNVPI
ncbi:MAG: YciI family protein [Myxococcales bacterium]|nr:YciI family protein [Myxococcales bacterium]